MPSPDKTEFQPTNLKVLASRARRQAEDADPLVAELFLLHAHDCEQKAKQVRTPDPNGKTRCRVQQKDLHINVALHPKSA